MGVTEFRWGGAKKGGRQGYFVGKKESYHEESDLEERKKQSIQKTKGNKETTGHRLLKNATPGGSGHLTGGKKSDW